MGENVYLEKGGIGKIPNSRNIIINSDDINRCFLNLCDNSVYSHEEELKNGFISLPNGCRAGICGTLIKRKDGSFWLRDINSINIRIASEIKGVAKDLFSKNLSGGVLFCGPPHSGKTTFLRDYIRLLSDNGEKIGLVDSRGEIAAVNCGKPTLDVGINTDIMTGDHKEFSIISILRTMAEDTIAFDEIGTAEELELIRGGFNGGVRIITTIHAENLESLLKRNKKIPILSLGVFSHIIMLDRRFQFKIIKADDIFA